jgi:hypothetical protein
MDGLQKHINSQLMQKGLIFDIVFLSSGMDGIHRTFRSDEKQPM